MDCKACIKHEIYRLNLVRVVMLIQGHTFGVVIVTLIVPVANRSRRIGAVDNAIGDSKESVKLRSRPGSAETRVIDRRTTAVY